MQSLAEEAKAEGKFAFEQYLRRAPAIDDPHDQHQCGRARGYFGFDELFIGSSVERLISAEHYIKSHSGRENIDLVAISTVQPSSENFRGHVA